MRNIHILPTDKPSKLHYFTANNAGYYLYPNNELVIPSNSNCINQHIYITSDKEIKGGNWYLMYWSEDTVLNKPMKADKDVKLQENCKKIILTTDLDLIKDGVQAIDDEFLKWFVKNSSCKFIETKHIGYVNAYNIIIPKEEPKQETNFDIHLKQEQMKFFEKIILVEQIFDLKQETLEEAIEFAKKPFLNLKSKSGWINDTTIEKIIEVSVKCGYKFGTKWRQQKSYSEEEVLKIIEARDEILEDFYEEHPRDFPLKEEWFEQFKKK